MLLEKNVLDMLSMKIFFQILFVWQENDLGFSSDLEKITLQKQKHQNSPLPAHTQHQNKFETIRVQSLTQTQTHLKNEHVYSDPSEMYINHLHAFLSFSFNAFKKFSKNLIP